MLDTNTLSDLIRNPRAALVQRLGGAEPASTGTSIVVGCKMRFGAKHKGSDVLTIGLRNCLAP